MTVLKINSKNIWNRKRIKHSLVLSLYKSIWCVQLFPPLALEQSLSLVKGPHGQKKKKSEPIIFLWWHHTQPCEVCGISVSHVASVYCVQGSLHMVSYLAFLTRTASALTPATPSPPLLVLLSPPPFPFIISTISSNGSEVRLGSNHNSSINYLRPKKINYHIWPWISLIVNA